MVSQNKLPEKIIKIGQLLKKNNFEAFLVGGCVRDLLLNKEPKDWDIATNAYPEQVLKIFHGSKYENKFGTVLVPEKYLIEKEKGIVEITTYRVESVYSDKRHPDKVCFAKTLQEDLSRRDFTINAMALEITSSIEKEKVIDFFTGQKDLKKGIIRAVGQADQRFSEDALRMMRAIRFSAQLGFSIEEKTFLSIKKNAVNLKNISQERIRDELIKIILSDYSAEGVDNLRKTGLLNIFLPELLMGLKVRQNHHHIYTVYQHNLLSLKNCPSKKLEIRLAALFHDIAKPVTKVGKGAHSTFYNHDFIGAKMTKKILTRLKFSKEIIKKTALLVANHMFYYNVGEVSEASVRRLIAKVGLENMRDLIDLRIADRLGSGVPKAKPYKLRHFEYMVEKVSTDAVSVKMLKINGNDLMRKLKIPAGPKIGAILEVLLAEVIEDSQKNEKNYLLLRAKKLERENLMEIRKMAQNLIKEKRKEDDTIIKKKYWVT